ncbi:MAG: hypothetical protein V4696_11095 [Pseudomonadota bacterium]
MSFAILAAILQVVASPAPAPSVAKPEKVVVDKRVCRTIGETGSRLGGTRECKMQSEWDRIAAENRQKAQGNMGR